MSELAAAFLGAAVSGILVWNYYRRSSNVKWCLLHESTRHQTFIDFCLHGYTLWFYSEKEERVSTCQFVPAYLKVYE